MQPNIFSEDFVSKKPRTIYQRVEVTDFRTKIEANTELNTEPKAIAFAKDVAANIFGDFEKSEDKMCHVSTFIVKNNKLYVSYYANTSNGMENPEYQVARLAYCDIDNPEEKTIIDIQSAGTTLCEREVKGVYDTILMENPNVPDTIYILWTAHVGGKYYRLYRTFNTKTETLGDIGVNRFKVGDIVNDYSSTGMQNALAENNIGYKDFFSDIGLMQKQSWREENGVKYCYSGTYSGNFTAIVKSSDLITWEYVAQPNEGANGTGFDNETKWENAVYVLNDKVYYFVRQWDPVYNDEGKLTSGSPYGILTRYDLITNEWEKPILVGDCQSRSDFIVYDNQLYMIYAPTNRNHLGILKINTDDLAKTECVLQADIKSSCFYPFWQYFKDNELAISYTVSRQHIRLITFNFSDYI